MTQLENIEGFDWDEGNINKNLAKHKVSNQECEDVFKNKPLLINFDKLHSKQNEERFQGLGKTIDGRKLFLSFTIRKNKIRIISSRNMSRSERKKYNEEEAKKT